jgi:hypothetical protein
MTDPGSAARDVQHVIDREVELVTSAINLVASGGAPSTMVFGLRVLDPVLEICQPLAVQRGVILEPMWGPDETAHDVRVRRRESAT